MFPGDTRITVIASPTCDRSRRSPRTNWIAELEEEAPHFLYTLMHMELPPLIGRLRIPVVATASKTGPGEQPHGPWKPSSTNTATAARRPKILFKDFYARFYEVVPLQRQAHLEQGTGPQGNALKHPIRRRHGNKRYVVGLAWKPAAEAGDA